MKWFQILALLLTLAALFGYLNFRYFKWPTTIGLMIFSMLFSLGILGAGWFFPSVHTFASKAIGQIDFNETLMHGMLGFLLFAGALHVDLEDLAQHKWTIGSLATVGVIVSTLIVGVLSFYILQALGLHVRFLWCLLFGALISPTDPIAVLAILKSTDAPKSLETKIAGESLLNDGVAVVVFLGLFQIATGDQGFALGPLASLFFKEAVGGAIWGFVIGYAAYRMLRTIDNYKIEILITLAVVAGGYAAATALHVSGPVAMVVAGLLLGNQGRITAMSSQTTERLDIFWELIDEILNAVLFVLIGLEILILTFTGKYLLAGLLMIPVVLLARFLSVGGTVAILRRYQRFSPHATKIMTWAGLRGGISLAMALSLPSQIKGSPVPERPILLVLTYVILVFSILVQGLTIQRLMETLLPKEPS